MLVVGLRALLLYSDRNNVLVLAKVLVARFVEVGCQYRNNADLRQIAGTRDICLAETRRPNWRRDQDKKHRQLNCSHFCAAIFRINMQTDLKRKMTQGF